MTATSAAVGAVEQVDEGDRTVGPSLRVLRPRRAAPDDIVRPTRAEIDLAALRHNLHVVRKAAGKARIWSVLKADGYGHGAPAVARTLERSGVDGIAVALLEEAIELRDAGIRAPILIMGGYYGRAYGELLAHDLVPVVYNAGHFEELSRAARLRGETRSIPVHLKIDSGMSRLGATLEELPSLLEVAAAFPQIAIDGVMTHLAAADGESDEARAMVSNQLTLFRRGLSTIRRAGHRPRYEHAANSAAVLTSATTSAASTPHGDARFNAVRPGIALFGVLPVAAPAFEVRPALRVRSEVVALRTVEAGQGVGYGPAWRAARRTIVATVPLGYADGLPRELSNCGAMLVRGKRAPIIGAISMDLCGLDVTDHPGVALRDEVVSLGEQRGSLGRDSIGIDEIAALAGRISWDVMTSISRRVPRFYRDA